jgi:putative ABC transport system ATP-binding protein
MQGNLNHYNLLKPDGKFLTLAVIYGVGIGVLTLAVPIAVQALMNTVIYTALIPFIVLLAVLLFILLVLTALLVASRDYAIELFQRRLLARMVSEAALRLSHADQAYMNETHRPELVHHFFEITHVQKNVSILLRDGFFTALQAIIGLLFVSFYHPFLFIYNLLFAGSLFLTWRLWAKQALKKGVILSNSKYALGEWLKEIARDNSTFKSEQAISYALEEADRRTATYLSSEKSYFKTTFIQHIGFLSLYCLASAILLGLGGMLVVRNQLSLGQLVGAELVMSVIFYSTSKLGYYAPIYYELYANLYKLDYFFKVPLEKTLGKGELTPPLFPTLSLNNVLVAYGDHEFTFNCNFPSGAKVVATSEEAEGAQLLIDLIKGHRQPVGGRILINNHDLPDYDAHLLRNHILSIDSTSVVQGSIKQLFSLYTRDLTQENILSALKLVELDTVLSLLPEGMDTPLIPSGYPLLQHEIIRLKLAAALSAKPKILVITEVFDHVPFKLRNRLLKELCKKEDMMLIYFTRLKVWDFFDQYLLIEKGETHSFPDAESFQREHKYES